MEFGRALRGGSSSLGPFVVVAVTTGALIVAACTGSSERSLPQQRAGKSETPTSTTTVVPARQTTLSSTTTLLSTTTKPPVTTTTTQVRAPVYDANGIPQVTASPRQGGWEPRSTSMGTASPTRTGGTRAPRCGCRGRAVILAVSSMPRPSTPCESRPTVVPTVISSFPPTVDADRAA